MPEDPSIEVYTRFYLKNPKKAEEKLKKLEFSEANMKLIRDNNGLLIELSMPVNGSNPEYALLKAKQDLLEQLAPVNEYHPGDFMAGYRSLENKISKPSPHAPRIKNTTIYDFK